MGNSIAQKLEAGVRDYRDFITEELKLPDVKARHIFTARLRIVVFLASWLMFLLFYPKIWVVSPAVPFIFNLGFLATAFCYYYIIRFNKIILSVMFLEVGSDILCQTALIYILGLENWAPVLIYGMYVVAVGVMTGFHSSLVASTLALVAYNALFLSVQFGLVPAFSYPLYDVSSYFPLQTFQPYMNLIGLPVCFVLLVYSVRIANVFTKIKELALARKNQQLIALNNIGSTIKRVVGVDRVINQVLKAVSQGLGFDICALVLIDDQNERIRFHWEEENYYVERLEEILGEDPNHLFLPVSVSNNSTNVAIKRNRILVRNNFMEMLDGVRPQLDVQRVMRAQKVLGFKKYVITPLVADRKVVGAIIGLSCKPFIEESVLETLDNFAVQAALALESAQLISRLRDKNEELIKANKVKTEFLAVMSHELRTPLNAVIGFAEALADGSLGEVSEDQAKPINEIKRNGHNLLELINSILDLARLESGRIDLNLDDFDLVELVQAVQSSLLPLAQKKQQSFTVHALQKMPFVKADAIKMRQVLNNLIGNAIKFTPEGGKVDLYLDYFETGQEAKQSYFPEIKLENEFLDAPAFCLRVKDNGPGIKEVDKEHIFDLFKQADSSFTRGHEGAGLGLALTKQLVNLHSGVITIESIYGEGSEFRIFLPQIVAQGA